MIITTMDESMTVETQNHNSMVGVIIVIE